MIALSEIRGLMTKVTILLALVNGIAQQMTPKYMITKYLKRSQ